MLPSQLWEGTVRATGAGGQVACATDFINLFAILDVALLGQRFHLFAALGVPFVIFALDAFLVRCRRAGKDDACAEQADQQN